jgi:hypothetical protein
MTSYLHVFLRPKAGVTQEAIKKKMNLAIDWYKYSDYCWLLKTTSNAIKWQSRLKPLVEPTGSLLIVEIDPAKRAGWISRSVWDWFKKHGVKRDVGPSSNR